MISDLTYTNRNLYIYNQIRYRSLYLLNLDTTSLHIKSFYHLVNTFTSSIWSTTKFIALIKLIFL